MITATAPVAPPPNLGGFHEAAFEAFVKGRDEPAWLIDRRRSAFDRLRATPLPTLRDEEWRRTDVRALKLDAFAPPAQASPSAEAIVSIQPALAALGGAYATGLAHIDGNPAVKADPAKLGGAILVDLATAAREHPEILRRYLLADPDRAAADAFAALHSAFWTGGTLLYVPKNVRVEAPLFTLIGQSAIGTAELSHTLVVLEEGADASLVQESVSAGREPGKSALHVGGVQLFLGRGARLRFVNVQAWDDATWHFGHERAALGPDAELQWTVGGLGARLAKVNQDVSLDGKGSRAQVNGVLFTAGRQHLAYATRQDHVAPHTTSDLLYKAGLKGRSRVVWRGMIRVEKDAQRTDAYQKNDNLVLSDTARADSIPGLEIEANDVRCTHGATAGRVDEDMVFYLRARGIGRDEAVRLIVEGFFADVYDRIAIEPVRETLRRAVAAKLNL